MKAPSFGFVITGHENNDNNSKRQKKKNDRRFNVVSNNVLTNPQAKPVKRIADTE